MTCNVFGGTLNPTLLLPPLTSNSSHLIAAYYILLIYRPQEDDRLSWPS